MAQKVQEEKWLLLVEDDDATAKVLVTVLERYGWGVVRVKTVVEGIILFRSSSNGFDLIISDLYTGGMYDGLEFLMFVRQYHQRADQRFILVSGNIYDKDGVPLVERVAALGATYLSKPISLKDLPKARP